MQHYVRMSRLTLAELDLTRGNDQYVVDSVTYTCIGERKGIRAYCGSDNRTIMGIAEDGVGARCAVILAQDGERWVFGDRGDWALRHIAYAVEHVFTRFPARA